MSEIQQVLRRRQVYHASLLAKGLNAALEIVGSIVLLLTPPAAIVTLVAALTQHELTEDPRDKVALFLLHQAQAFSLSTEHFFVIYLAFHGIVKTLVVIGLWRRWPYSTPLGTVALGLFVVWQLYRYSVTHGPFLLALSAFDLLIMWLIWRDAKDRKNEQPG